MWHQSAMPLQSIWFLQENQHHWVGWVQNTQPHHWYPDCQTFWCVIWKMQINQNLLSSCIGWLLIQSTTTLQLWFLPYHIDNTWHSLWHCTHSCSQSCSYSCSHDCHDNIVAAIALMVHAMTATMLATTTFCPKPKVRPMMQRDTSHL